MVGNKIKTSIKKMNIKDIDRVLLTKYNIKQEKLQTYPEDIKRDLLFDLETHV
jgi:hypothetical protein